MVEQWDFIGVQFDFVVEIWMIQCGDMLVCQFKYFWVIDQDFVDVLVQVVMEGVDNDVVFLVDQEWCWMVFCGFLNCFLVFQVEVQVLLQGFGGFVDVSGVNDQVYVVWKFQVCQCFFQFGMVVVFDMVGNFFGVWVVWYQYQIVVCQVDKGGECSVFVVVFFFINLYDNFLIFLQYVFDIRMIMCIVVGGEVFVGDFFEGEEIMMFGVVINKCGFKVGFNVGDFVFVDVCFFLFVFGVFDIQVVQVLFINKGDV